MPQILIFIFGFIIGGTVVWLLFYSLISSKGEQARKTIKQKKEKRKQKILELMKKKEGITNNDVQKLLNVSDATATNYLEELEKEGKITQKGKTGRGVFYEQING